MRTLYQKRQGAGNALTWPLCSCPRSVSKQTKRVKNNSAVLELHNWLEDCAIYRDVNLGKMVDFALLPTLS